MSESIWQHPRTGTNHIHDRGREVALTQLKRQHGKAHFTIKCRVVARVFINHTHSVGKKMIPFKLLEVYYIKNKKSGKRSENIMVKKIAYCYPRDTIPGRRRESPIAIPLDQQGFVVCKGLFNNYII